ncbi:transcription factor atf-2-like [Lepeophtheirus salmonis]|uniref:transcription factor atf-2-like n=1 Tax=Lepeophtheirus salmonis TaxID=72036 RepID=UPI003AF3B1AF
MTFHKDIAHFNEAIDFSNPFPNDCISHHKVSFEIPYLMKPSTLSMEPQRKCESMDSLSGTSSIYQEKRRKNNESAKRCRDSRRAKEEETALRAAFLEQENVFLKWELAALKTETEKLRIILLSFNHNPSPTMRLDLFLDRA